MRNPGGYGIAFASDDRPLALWFDSSRRDVEIVRSHTFETDYFRCDHCSRQVRVKPKEDPANIGGMCKRCMKLICCHCVGKGCDPFEEKLKRIEDTGRFRRSLNF